MRESIFSGRIPISSPNEDIPWQMKCDITRREDKLEIRLIDIKDLFSFFVCTISSGDFYLLKREQDIRVDFETFIRKTVEMFHSLTRNKLIGMFNRETNKFIFLERNDFKNIIRLELKFTKPEELHYKRYLSDLIYRMETDNIKLIKENNFLKEQCKNGDIEMSEKIKFLEMDLREGERRSNNLMKELGALEEKYMKKSNAFDSLEKENYEMRDDLKKLSYEMEKIKDNENKITLHNRKVNELTIANKKLEDKISDLEEMNKLLEEEIEGLKKNYEEKREESKEIKSTNIRMKKEYEEIKIKYKEMDEQYKLLKNASKNNESKLKELENENKILKKQLENTHSVYHHFYNKSNNKDVSPESDESVFNTVRPESPPK